MNLCLSLPKKRSHRRVSLLGARWDGFRNKARVNHDLRQWCEGLTQEQMNVVREPVGRSEAPKPQLNVTEPTKASCSPAILTSTP